MNRTYLETARLLTRVAPLIFTDNSFALKGGTAINMFVREMPRLSVDLDLVFFDHRLVREQALQRINAAIRHASERLKSMGFQTHVATHADVGETKLLIRRSDLEVKVEVNFVMRGTVYPVRVESLTVNRRIGRQARYTCYNQSVSRGRVDLPSCPLALAGGFIVHSHKKAILRPQFPTTCFPWLFSDHKSVGDSSRILLRCQNTS